MFDKIVIATDLSKSSDAVIGSLGGLRMLGAQQAVLVHALGLKYMKDVIPILVDLAEPRLSEQKEALEQQGFATTVRIAHGVPMVEVNQIAKEENASLIVVGSHGASCTQEILLGGAALAILHYASRPVLLVRIKIIDEPSPPRCKVAFQDLFKRILYAADFSETAERAFMYVEKIVEAGAKHITLLHVQEKSDLSKYVEDRLEEFNQMDRERLERMRDRLMRLGAADVQIEIPYGSPLQEIIRYASQNDHSLIVMGSKGRGFLAEVFMGSVSRGVALHSDVPLLMIPPS
ncbi:MAG: universal stress protein, partial [Syntrophaceae bacterium]|nr:universal stress protein [Syntrophaceae bacterium]